MHQDFITALQVFLLYSSCCRLSPGIAELVPISLSRPQIGLQISIVGQIHQGVIKIFFDTEFKNSIYKNLVFFSTKAHLSEIHFVQGEQPVQLSFSTINWIL